MSLRLKTQAAVKRAGLGQAAAGTVSRAVEQARAAAMPQAAIPQALPLAQPVAPLPVQKVINSVPPRALIPGTMQFAEAGASLTTLGPLVDGVKNLIKPASAAAGFIGGLFITSEGMFIS